MKRIIPTLLLSLCATAILTAANYGTDHFAMGEYALAKKWFEQNQSQNTAEASYYLGEIAFKEGNVEGARVLYEKGLAANPSYALNMVGKAKTLLKSSKKEADALFKAALKVDKKDMAVLLAIAEAFKENGMTDEYEKRLNATKKANKNSALLYIYEGDRIMAGTSETKVSDALAKYSQAMNFEPSNAVAQMKYAQVYLLTDSYDRSIETEIKVLEAHPDYTIALRDLANAYTNKGVYRLAIENYQKYFEFDNYTVTDIRRFAQSYFFNDQFEEAMELIQEGLTIEPDHFVLNRLRMYCVAKLKDTLNSLSYADKFFSLRPVESEESKFIYRDFLSYAIILAELGRYDEAMAQFDKVVNSEERFDRGELYEAQAECYTKMKQYAKAGEAYDNYVATFGEATPVSIFLRQGQSYYRAALESRKDSTDTGKALLVEYVSKADSAFAKTIEWAPDSYVGYMWRGNTNVLLDPESTQGLAKPYYEGAINAIMNVQEEGTPLSATHRSQLKTSYLYLAVYYFKADDKDNSVLYAQKVQELDSTEKVTKAILEEYQRLEAEAATPQAAATM